MRHIRINGLQENHHPKRPANLQRMTLDPHLNVRQPTPNNDHRQRQHSPGPQHLRRDLTPVGQRGPGVVPHRPPQRPPPGQQLLGTQPQQISRHPVPGQHLPVRVHQHDADG
jgi:hypothetical protein